MNDSLSEVKVTDEDNEKFWSKVQKGNGARACWLWTASKKADLDAPTETDA